MSIYYFIFTEHFVFTLKYELPVGLGLANNSPYTELFKIEFIRKTESGFVLSLLDKHQAEKYCHLDKVRNSWK